MASSDEDVVELQYSQHNLKVTIRCGEITEESCEAIVNSTSKSMDPNENISDFKMHKKMGQYFTDQVIAVHKTFGENSCGLGNVRIFLAKYEPKSNEPIYIINTVGPSYNKQNKEECNTILKSCFYNSLALANIYQLRSIAFPLITNGFRIYPAEEYALIAWESIKEYHYNIEDVRLVFSDKKKFRLIADYFIQQSSNLDTPSPLVDRPISHVKSDGIELSNSICHLCSTGRIPKNGCLLCNECITLEPVANFSKILFLLKNSSSISEEIFIEQCRTFKSICDLFLLNYQVPLKFDARHHTLDNFLQSSLKDFDKIYQTSRPVTTRVNENKFYNLFVNLCQTDTRLSTIELRVRNIIEINLNRARYVDKYHNILMLLYPLEIDLLEERGNKPDQWSLWEIMGISTVLDSEIQIVLPNLKNIENSRYQPLKNYIFTPLHTNQEYCSQKLKSPSTTSKQSTRIKLLMFDSRENLDQLSETDRLPFSHYAVLLE